MYPNFIEDRKALGYGVLTETSCGIKLVLITDSTVLIIKNFPLNLKVKSKRIIFIDILGFSNVQPSSAIGLSMPPNGQISTDKLSREISIKNS